MTFSKKIPDDIDYTNQEQMDIFGIKILQHGNLLEGINLLHYRHLPFELLHTTFRTHCIMCYVNISTDTYLE